MVSGLVSLYSRPVQNTSGLDGGIIVVAAKRSLRHGGAREPSPVLGRALRNRVAADVPRCPVRAEGYAGVRHAADDGSAWHRGGEAGAADSGEGQGDEWAAAEPDGDVFRVRATRGGGGFLEGDGAGRDG